MRARPVLARRIGVAIIAFAALATTSACAAGQHAMTAQESPTVDGTAGIIGALHLNAVAIKAPTSGTSYPAGSAVQIQAAIINTGTDVDQLVGVSATGASGSGLYASLNDAAAVLSPSASASAESSSASAQTSSAPSAPSGTSTTGSASGSSTEESSSPALSESASSAGSQLTSLDLPPGQLTGVGLAPDDKTLVVTGLSAPLYPGMALTVTFKFAHAGLLTLQVPVQLTAGLTSPASVSAPATESTAA